MKKYKPNKIKLFFKFFWRELDFKLILSFIQLLAYISVILYIIFKL